MKKFTFERTYEVSATIEIVERDGKYYAEVDKNLEDLWKENDEYECWIEDGHLMTEKCNTQEEYDAIIETFRSYILPE